MQNFSSDRGISEKAEFFALQAATSSQASGDKWSLPERLQTLAELQAARGKYTEADQTYDKASAFIDSALANSSTILEKTALIKASGTLYPEHFDLVVNHLHNPAKGYSIMEQVRGRINADLLMAGSLNSQKAKDIEHGISVLQLDMMSAKALPDLNRLRNQLFTIQESRWVTPGVSILKRQAQDFVSMDLVRQSLNSDTTILEYVVGEERSYCPVMTRTATRIVPLTRISHRAAAKRKNTAPESFFEDSWSAVRFTGGKNGQAACWNESNPEEKAFLFIFRVSPCASS